MKKTTLIAAAAALLLSGGVFLKANQKANFVVDALIENIKASAEDGEYSDFPPVRDAHQQPNYCKMFVYVTANGSIGNTQDEGFAAAVGAKYEQVEGLHDNCSVKGSKGEMCYPFPCRQKY